jgi:hypothetical protein
MKTALSIALIAGLLTVAGGNLSMQSQPLSHQQQAQRPIELVQVTPDENDRLTNSKITVSARFEFLRGRRPVLPRSLKLLIDGVDVTRQSRIAATEDTPSSQGEILYTPSQPFSVGQHTAEVRFANDQDKPFSYTWNFYIQRRD